MITRAAILDAIAHCADDMAFTVVSRIGSVSTSPYAPWGDYDPPTAMAQLTAKEHFKRMNEYPSQSAAAGLAQWIYEGKMFDADCEVGEAMLKWETWAGPRQKCHTDLSLWLGGFAHCLTNTASMRMSRILDPARPAPDLAPLRAFLSAVRRTSAEVDYAGVRDPANFVTLALSDSALAFPTKAQLDPSPVDAAVTEALSITGDPSPSLENARRSVAAADLLSSQLSAPDDTAWMRQLSHAAFYGDCAIFGHILRFGSSPRLRRL